MREEKIIESVNKISIDYPTMQILNITILDGVGYYRFNFLLFDPDNNEVTSKQICINKGI